MRPTRGLILAIPIAVALAVACGGSYHSSSPPADGGAAEASNMPAASPLVTLTASPADITLAEGASQTIAVNVARAPTFHDALQVTLAGLPAKVTVVPAIALLGASEAHAEFTITREKGALPGDFAFSAHAAGGTADATTAITAHFPAVPGDLDRAFGKDGIVATAENASALAFAADGSVVLGRKTAGGVEVLRFDASGQRDMTWGISGAASAAAGVVPESMLVGKQGNVLIAGQANGGDGVRLAAFTPVGKWLTQFGDAGVVVPSEDPGISSLRGMAVRPSGKALLGFRAQASAPRMLQTRGDLGLDDGFGFDAGLDQVLASGPIEVTDADEAYVVLLGWYQTDTERSLAHLLTRLDDSGASGSFGTKLISRYATATRIRLTADGSVIAVSNEDDTIVARRYSHEGVLDASFGAGGMTKLVGTTSLIAVGIAVTPDGGVLILESVGSGADSATAVAKLRPNGALDTSFGDVGTVKLPFNGAATGQIALLPSGRIGVAVITVTGLTIARLYP